MCECVYVCVYVCVVYVSERDEVRERFIKKRNRRSRIIFEPDRTMLSRQQEWKGGRDDQDVASQYDISGEAEEQEGTTEQR